MLRHAWIYCHDFQGMCISSTSNATACLDLLSLTPGMYQYLECYGSICLICPISCPGLGQPAVKQLVWEPGGRQQVVGDTATLITHAHNPRPEDVRWLRCCWQACSATNVPPSHRHLPSSHSNHSSHSNLGHNGHGAAGRCSSDHGAEFAPRRLIASYRLMTPANGPPWVGTPGTPDARCMSSWSLIIGRYQDRWFDFLG
jgi:hypothetical protein